MLPLVALVGGLVLIQDWQNRTQISVAAEVDEALLGDDLPINAYRDPGFIRFTSERTGETIFEIKMVDGAILVWGAHYRPSEFSASESLVSLPGSAEELWKGLDSKVRNQVRKGKKQGFSVAWGGLELLEGFYHVLSEYMRELSGEAAAYMRPNFFTNTPDILTEYLQHGGPAAFKVRATLAALLSPTWGMYSGFELCENVPVRPGSEEYLDSEKYAYRPRDWAAAERGPMGIAPFITRLNLIRRSHPALHWLRNLRFHYADQPGLLCFSKRSSRDADTVLAVVNTDPHQPREATVWLDMSALGVDDRSQFVVTDELTGESYRWGQVNYVRLDPATAPAHIFAVTPDPAA